MVISTKALIATLRHKQHPEARKTKTNLACSILLRVIAYCRRFVCNCRYTKKETRILHSTDILEVLKAAFLMAQQGVYSQEIKDLHLKITCF